MNKAPPRISIGKILDPGSVAVFGASDDLSKWGGRIMHYLTLHGYEGRVIPINPRRETVRGLRCYPRIAEAPHADVAVIAVPATAVPDTVKECAEAGVGCCVVITAGFDEAGSEGQALQRKIEDVVAQTGLRLVGPNCLGLINFRNGMALTSARVLDVEKIIAGGIGLVSQSGALMLSVYNRAHDQGIGFSQIVSVGNQADLEICDFFEHMIGDPETQVICLHIEGLRDGRRYESLLEHAREAQKPVIVLKTGRSAAGERAARSHTASLAGSYAVFEAASRKAGAVLVDDPDAMVLTADFIARHGRPRSGGIGILSPSGGINGIVVDRLADSGLPLAEFAETTRVTLSKYLLAGHAQNPVDMGARRSDVGESAQIAQPIAAAVGADPNVGVVLVPLTTIPNYEVSVAGIADGLNAAGAPSLVAVTPGSVATKVRGILREKGISYCDRIDDAIRLLKAYASAVPAAKAVTRPASADIAPKLIRSGYLTEPEAMALLAAAGVRVVQEITATSAETALAAAREIGFPVVLKGVSARVVHKSDAGLVELGIKDESALVGAYRNMRARLVALDPEATECLVAETVASEAELIVGAKLDPQFGPAVLVGSGGILVELLGDVRVALAPLSRETALGLLRDLRVWPLLSGYRGRPELDVEAVVDTIVKVGELAASLGERLVELDINPLMIRRKGEGAIAVDARAVVA